VKKIIIFLSISFFLLELKSVYSKQEIHLTLNKAVDIAIKNSYRTKQLELGIQRSMHWLRARQASLRSQVYMNLQTPDLNNISEYKWNSDLGHDEIVRQNTQRWQSDMSIKYPLMLFGYPTNGYLSLNHKFYRYLQKDHGDDQVDYYNRLYLKFEQPFFLPNELKNDLEDAQLDLQDIKLEYINERVEIIEDIAQDYYEIFDATYDNNIYQNQLTYLEQAQQISDSLRQKDGSQSFDNEQISLEIANVREKRYSSQSRLRRRLVYIKQRLRLNSDDSLYVTPLVKIIPVQVDLPGAIRLGYENSPWLQRLKIRYRRSELDVENEKAQNAFHLRLEVTYGLEKGQPSFYDIWHEFDNSNSITLNAYVPIWDGGQRKERIQAEMLDLEQRLLQIEEEKEDIKNDIRTAYTNLNEYYDRSHKMLNSLELAKQITETSLQKYAAGQISLQDLLQIIERTRETEQNFLEVYLGYRQALLDLMTETYYDYEKNVSLYDTVRLMLD